MIVSPVMVELLSINTSINQSLLHVKISSEQEDREVFWKIDDETAKNLSSLVGFEPNYKYRLSLMQSWDSVKETYTSFFTRTYRDFSERCYFKCTKEYIKDLHAIKHRQQVDHFQASPTLSSLSPTAPSPEKEKNSKKNYRMFIWTTVAILNIILFILYEGSGYTYLNKIAFAAKIPVKDELAMNKVNQDGITYSSAPLLKKSVFFLQPIPFKVTLHKTMNFSIQDGDVALTFDDGPSRYTKEIVDILNQYKIGATFFFVGDNVKRFPNSVKYVHSNGYSIGNHSMTHSDFVRLGAKGQESEMTNTSRLLEHLIHEPVTLFRPPYGANNKTTKDLMSKLSIKMVLWNRDPKDWETRNPNKILHYIEVNKESGAIILLHESRAVVNTLPRIIKYLKKQDLNIVSLT